MIMRRLSAVLAGLALVLVSCDNATAPEAQIPRPEIEQPTLPEVENPPQPEGGDPDGVDENGLPIFLRFAPGVVPDERTVSFWAVQGKTREAKIRNAVTGRDLVKLKVTSRAELHHPDGRAFAVNDSVLITMTLDPDGRVLAEFAPAGLGFGADDGAELTIAYDVADPDFNGSGLIDPADLQAEDSLSIWRQGADGEPFAPRPSSRDRIGRKLVAIISGFSRYAIAY
jgi:hypothetical protein